MTIVVRTAGLVINPVAGEGGAVGYAKSASAARCALARLGWKRILTGSGTSGADALVGLSLQVETLDVGFTGRERTQALARRLLATGIDALMVVGGDGTLADVAAVLVQEGARVPVFGLGTGSTNAGALVTCRAAGIESLDPTGLQVITMPALLAHHNGTLLGAGFNDCVIGFTVVATVDGQLRDVSIAEKIQGRNAPGQPGAIGTEHTRIIRYSQCGEDVLGEGPSVGTVVVGFAEPAFTAKALTGGACLAAFTGLPAGCLVASFPLVQVELSQAGVLQLPPIHTTYVSLDSSTQIVARGLKAGAGLCVDGNPLALLAETDEVRFSVIETAVQVFKP